MPRPACSRFALSLLTANLLLPLGGCKFIARYMAEQANANPNSRPEIVEAARSSCLKTMHEKFPQEADRETIIVNYCACFSERGLKSFSDAELVQIGLRPGNVFTADEQKKLDAAGDMCMAEAKSKVAASADRRDVRPSGR